MEKATKVKLVEEIQDKFKRASATFVADYKGIQAMQMDELRKNLRSASIDFKIVRNTLAKRAIKGTSFEPMSEHLKGSTAIAFSYKDAALAAKTLTQFAKDQPKLKIRMGTLGNKVIGANEIKGLAELPPREVLLSMLLGTMKNPMTGLAMVLSGVPRKLLYALNAVKDQKAGAAA